MRLAAIAESHDSPLHSRKDPHSQAHPCLSPVSNRFDR